MTYFKGVMSIEEQRLYMSGGPEVPIKDVSKRLPPTKLNTQLNTIRESTSEVPIPRAEEIIRPASAMDHRTTSHSSHSSSHRMHRKNSNISLFPDPSRHQLKITIPDKPVSAGKNSRSSTAENSVSSFADEVLTGLAKAKQKAMESRKKDVHAQSPLFDSAVLSRSQSQSVKPKASLDKERSDDMSSNSSSSPINLRRQWSRVFRSKSDDSIKNPPPSVTSISPEPKLQSPYMTPATSVSTSSRVANTPPSSLTKSSYQLQEVVEFKPSNSKHVRQSPSMSSIRPLSPPSGLSSEEGSDSKTKHTRQTSSTSKLPVGVPPDQAARHLPPAVKLALGNHAQSESMGYLVLLPNEVVQLNDEHLALEKQIDSIKKELNAVRHQSAQLHEKMLDELRLCASSNATDSSAIDKLLHLQIDVATVEVRLDHTSRRLSKAQHRRAEVRERLLMHLAGTHAMIECEKRLMREGSTPPESPVRATSNSEISRL